MYGYDVLEQMVFVKQLQQFIISPMWFKGKKTQCVRKLCLYDKNSTPQNNTNRLFLQYIIQ